MHLLKFASNILNVVKFSAIFLFGKFAKFQWQSGLQEIILDMIIVGALATRNVY